MLANFFDKAALSIGSLLQGLDSEAIRTRLLGSVIGVAWDASAAASPEARHTLDLTIDLLARLYPRIALLGTPCDVLVDRLARRAREINEVIDLANGAGDLTVCIVLGAISWSATQSVGTQTPVLFLGSDGWIASMSSDHPLGSGSSANPFGAGAAACLGAAAVFRTVFSEYLPDPIGDDRGTLSLSVLDMRISGSATETRDTVSQLERASIDIGETFLVGAGAIGNGVIWALARTPELRGGVCVIDGEAIDLSNLQRYVLTSHHSIGLRKVEVASAAFAAARASGNRLKVSIHAGTWASFVSARGVYNIDRVVLALDSAEDRIAVQASLPRWIANAWTQPENLGVSRHDFLGPYPCVACLYFPTAPKKNKDQLYAEALKCTTEEELLEVRTLLHNGRAVGRNFIERVASRFAIDTEELARFEQVGLDQFYVGVLCGGIVFRLGGGVAAGRPAEVPMAFQSALAGILLAAELVVDAGALRDDRLPARTEIDLLRLSMRLGHTMQFSSPATKLASGRCICQDAVFRRAYQEKWEYPSR